MPRHDGEDDGDDSRQDGGEEGNPQRATKQEFADVRLADGEMAERVLAEVKGRVVEVSEGRKGEEGGRRTNCLAQAHEDEQRIEIVLVGEEVEDRQ